MARPQLLNLDTFTDNPEQLDEASNLFGLLACYLDHKARKARLTGTDQEAAESYDRAAEYQYARLPDWAKWR